MKTGIQFLWSILLLFANLSAFSQKYKTPADSIKLNREYEKVSSDIADLTAELTKEQANLPVYQGKATSATADAKAAAAASDVQASKATNGNLKDAKRANKKAQKAFNEAKDSQSADNKVSSASNKIDKLTKKLNKKKKRLTQLEVMRSSIRRQVTLPNPAINATHSFRDTTPSPVPIQK